MRANYPRIAIEISFLLSIFVFALISSMNNSVDYADRTFYIFVFCVLRLVPIFGRITNDVTSIKAGTPALCSIAKIEMKKVSNDDDKHNLGSIEDFKSEISLEGISYYFDESSDPQLENVFLRIERGDKIAIVGGSGQGKTTLLEIILGLRKPTNGQILIDGRLLENYELWKPYVGYVSQKYEVYNHSLRQAVTFDFFSEDIDVDRFAKISNALEFEEETIARLQNFSEESKFNQNLSGGQLQRIAVARALYSQSNFLVLDEVTSNLDAHTSKKIIELLLNSDRTVLLVTHKLSEVNDFDKIICVKDGDVSIDLR
jgi:ATP-binding cassette subfamily C protein